MSLNLPCKVSKLRTPLIVLDLCKILLSLLIGLKMVMSLLLIYPLVTISSVIGIPVFLPPSPRIILRTKYILRFSTTPLKVMLLTGLLSSLVDQLLVVVMVKSTFTMPRTSLSMIGKEINILTLIMKVLLKISNSPLLKNTVLLHVQLMVLLELLI